MYRLPIEWTMEKQKISNEVLGDLQLLDGSKPLYNALLHIDHPSNIERTFIKKYAQFYTNDKSFLKDSQMLVREGIKNFDDPMITDKFDVFADEESESSFKNTYGYLEWDALDFINQDSKALHGLYIYSVGSPLLSLIIPIITIIIPLVCLVLSDERFTLGAYISWLTLICRNQSIVDIFRFPSLSPERKIYLTGMIVFYCFQTYMNVLTCRKYVQNINQVCNRLQFIKRTVTKTVNNMASFISATKHLASYSDFNKELLAKHSVLKKLNSRMNKLGDISTVTSKIRKIGSIMSIWYDIHQHNPTRQALEYGIECNVHIKHINILHSLVENKELNTCKFTTKKTVFKGVKYLQLAGTSCVPNTIRLTKSILITGPNAAGKTTLIKSALSSILLSQQFGLGPYKSAQLNPYHTLHCYLNIPDTCNRESLFQAEAARCKTILDSTSNGENKRHFCVFDELFSGTNPKEAVSTGAAFVNHIANKKNVDFILTTHLSNMCTIVGRNSKLVRNMQMSTNLVGDEHVPTFIMAKGISKIEGAVGILKNMDFPEDVLNQARSLGRG